MFFVEIYQFDYTDEEIVEIRKLLYSLIELDFSRFEYGV